MKAMIFAAGMGTRLKPLTDTIPKALVPVGGKPLLQHIIEKLKRFGFNEIIINIHHFGQQIIDFVQENNSFDIRIEFSDEREQLLDTGGGIKKAAWFFDDNKPFLVHNVDILSNIDLQELYHFHLKNNTIATLLCSIRQTSRYLLFDTDNHLRGWINTKTGEVKSPIHSIDPFDYQHAAFSGIQILSPAIFSYMASFEEKFSTIDFYLSICDKANLTAFIPNNQQVFDVGKIDTLSEADNFIFS
jgi:NDP-sugar pyrophosphorylase family protein